jgi:DNA-binding transcriptional MocR family regulator
VGNDFVAVGRAAVAAPSARALYLRLADALAERLARRGGDGLPSARRIAAEIGVNRATVTAAYRELAQRGLLVLRPGRPARRPAGGPALDSPTAGDPPPGGLDLARYAPDRSLVPSGRVLRWLGLGDGEGESVVNYGDVRGFARLREALAGRMAGWGMRLGADDVLLTAGVQHGLDLVLRATTRPGDVVLVEDPTYPGLPPLLAIHRLRAVGLPVHRDGVHDDELRELVRRHRPLLAIVTPTLQNPSGVVLETARRKRLLTTLAAAGTLVVEEQFDPGLVIDGGAPPPLAALDPGVLAVGSFSKALFPGLRVGWMTGPRALLDRVAAVKQATDLSGSSFLEATAWALCRRGELDRQLERLRRAAEARRDVVLEELGRAGGGVGWSVPRGGFSLLVSLPEGTSSRAVAARAAGRGAWVLPGPLMSVSGRDDVVRLAFAAAGGARLRDGVRLFVAALGGRAAMPLV